MSAADRISYVKENNRCMNCLKYKCRPEQCASSQCKRCGKKHNTLLHINMANVIHATSDDPEQSTIGETSQKPVNTIDILACSTNKQHSVVLTTALINVRSSNGQYKMLRALLDSGSQVTIISKAAAQLLSLNISDSDITVSGINQNECQVHGSTNIVIAPISLNQELFTEAIVMHKITRDIPAHNLQQNINMPNNIILADPTFNKSGKIDILLGADLFFKTMLQQQITIGNIIPIFGWLVSGKLQHDNIVQQRSMVVNICTLEDQLSKFWEIEDVHLDKHATEEHTLCEKSFVENVRRDENGRYIVTLPLRQSPSVLGDSYKKALKRFYALERQFLSNPKMHEEYTQFMNEYLELGHMKEAKPLVSHEGNCYYLSHHAIFKETSTTTKVRVVFNASMTSSNNLSLNDILMTGPVVQDDIMTILLRFRIHPIVMTADVTKMYRQFMVTDKQRDLQRIIWRADPADSIKEYKLNTITYGTSSASYLATRCLQQIALDEGSKYNPLATKSILNDFYMDDLLTGVNDIDTAKSLYKDISAILRAGGLHLRKWCSNSNELLDQIDKADRETTFLFSNNTAVKTLGLYWQPNTDCFKFNISTEPKPTYTKREVVADVSRIFDPLGLISPVITKAKILLQDLWIDKIDWDENINADHLSRWKQFQKNLQTLNNLSLDRLSIPQHQGKLELHGFADSSERAYGAVLYVKGYDEVGNVHISLACSKSRLAPIKKVTLPKLELCGLLLLARLINKFLNSTNLNFDRVYCWSDSTIALAWVAGTREKLKIFVANRVREIQQLTASFIWKHVKSADNPADLISRGVDASKLDSRWFSPKFLKEESLPPARVQCQQVVESAPATQTSVEIDWQLNNLLNKYSSWNRLLSVVAYVLRFIYNCKNENKARGSLSLSEARLAENKICSLIQKYAFRDYALLCNGQPLPNNSKLLPLSPFLDENKVIRVGGRLQNSTLSFNSKHPVLLPKNHHVTLLIATFYHNTYCHVGPQSLLAIMRQKFWPINGKGLVRNVTRKCIRCFRVKPRNSEPLMGALPPSRVRPSRTFSISGVDFCGPINIRQSMNRRVVVIKAYIAIFICMSTKAVHIELVRDLSTAAFIAALKRFCARRGRIVELHCDNATNFVGCRNLLTEFHELLSQDHNLSEINKAFFPEPIKFVFIPPNSPHFGGLWESSVKTVKYHLRRVVANSLLVFEEMYTVLCTIEACINSRPITALSEDPNDFGALTPAHFLTGDNLLLPVEPSLAEVHESRLSRWQRVQNIMHQFWNKWSKDYLSTLQRRSKWRQSVENLKLNDLVLLKDDNVVPLTWPLARVIKLHTGSDGTCRVVTVKTPNGSEFTRSVVKLCKLPIEA